MKFLFTYAMLPQGRAGVTYLLIICILVLLCWNFIYLKELNFTFYYCTNFAQFLNVSSLLRTETQSFARYFISYFLAFTSSYTLFLMTFYN
jgi:hypothetical protein